MFDVKKALWDYPVVFPLFLLLICVLTYGVIAPSLGFSWDEWPAIWLYQVYGAEGLGDFFATNRPLLGVFYAITLKVFGTHSLAWQIFALLTRFGVGLSIWWVLKLLWPAHQKVAKWVAAFVVVFPGFAQQFIAVIYSHIMLALIFYFISVGLMLLALDGRRRFYPLLGFSLFFAALNLFATEYFVGLELLRPVFIFLYLSDGEKKAGRLKGILTRWWPYALLMVIYLTWRIPFQSRFAQAPANLLTAIIADPFPNLLKLFRELISTPVVAGIAAWVYPFQSIRLETGTYWGNTQVFVMLACGVLALMYFSMSRSQENKVAWIKQALLVSGFAFFLAGIPFVIADLPVKVTFPHDRFMLAFLFGSCLFLVALSTVVFKRVAREVFLSLLLAVCVGYQFQVGLTFKDEWENVWSFLGQLSWRVPGLEPGTTLIANETLFPHTNDYSLTAPLNWLYDQEPDSGDLDYYMAYVPHRLGGVIPELQPDLSISKKYSLYQFTGSTSNVLAVVYEPPACLRILDPRFDRYDLRLTPELHDAMWLSDPGRLIQPEQAIQNEVLEELITPSPIADKWCQTYQKADLARQEGDWREVIRLWEIAPDLGGIPKNPVELLPFIEGYARLGEYQKALDLTLIAFNADIFNQLLLCDLWLRVGPDSQGIYEQVNQTLNCW